MTLPPTGRILVVDDVEVNRDLLTRRVRRLGHHVDEAIDGEQALAMVADAAPRYDVILLDVMMPGLNGYEVLERIKTDADLAATRVIMVSAVDEIDSVVRCIELGADDYLSKPFNPVLLEARLTSSLARKQLDDAQRAHAEALERELEIGREIQAGFLPQAAPDVDNWAVATWFTPARQVAGDFYDVFRLPDGRLTVLVGDVCDKGVGAALYMALFRSLIRSRAIEPAGNDHAAPVSAALRHANDYIATVHGDANMFATVAAATIDLTSGAVEMHNAGHDAPVLRRRDGTLEVLSATGPALGLVAGSVPAIISVTLHPGEVIVMTTDGVSEAVNADGQFLDDAAVHHVIAAAPGLPASQVDALVAAVETHRGDVPLHDDVTIAAIGRLDDTPPEISGPH